MLALFLNHPPMFVTGEIALCLSLALFVGALIAAIVRRASEISLLREAGHPNATIVRQSLAEPVYVRPNVPRPATATTPVVRSRPRSALRNKAPSVEATWSRRPSGQSTEIPDKAFDSSREGSAA
jgi:hypothetical protein